MWNWSVGSLTQCFIFNRSLLAGKKKSLNSGWIHFPYLNIYMSHTRKKTTSVMRTWMLSNWEIHLRLQMVAITFSFLFLSPSSTPLPLPHTHTHPNAHIYFSHALICQKELHRITVALYCPDMLEYVMCWDTERQDTERAIEINYNTSI